MAGSKKSAKKAAQTNFKRYGKDFYKKIGEVGGKNGHTGGFYVNRELAMKVGKLGGTISRRGVAKVSPEEIELIKQEFYNAEV